MDEKSRALSLWRILYRENMKKKGREVVEGGSLYMYQRPRTPSVLASQFSLGDNAQLLYARPGNLAGDVRKLWYWIKQVASNATFGREPLLSSSNQKLGAGNNDNLLGLATSHSGSENGSRGQYAVSKH